MTHWITYAVGIEGFVIILLVYGLTIFFNAVRKVDGGGIRVAFFLILGALAIQILQGATVAMLLAKQVTLDNPLWTMFPLFSLVGAFLLAIGAKRFLEEVNR